MIIEYKKGDVLDAFSNSEYDCLLHSANCFHTMGSGIAKQIRNRFPQAYTADKKTPYGDIKKLGLYSSVYIEDMGVIVNAYTQLKFGTDKRYCDYDAIANVMKLMNEDFKGKHFCIPLISCNLAGGDWNIIEKIINDNTPDIKFTVYALN